MRARRSTARILVLLASICVASSAEAKSWDVIPPEIRTASEPLPLVVHLPQQGLRAGRDPGPAQLLGGGGLIGALVDSAFQSSLAKSANGALGPARGSATEWQADVVLMAAIRKAVGSLPWVAIADGGALRDDSRSAKGALLDQAEGSRLLDVDCSYNISQRFQAVYAYCSMQIASKGGTGTSEARWKDGNLLYAHYVEVEIELANPAKSIGGRREQWLANSGVLLRRGLDLALNKLGMLVGRQLLWTSADLEAAKTAPQERIADMYVGMAYVHKGRVIAGNDNILGSKSPNLGGRLLLFKPGADGVVTLEDGNNLYYNYSIDSQ